MSVKISILGHFCRELMWSLKIIKSITRIEERKIFPSSPDHESKTAHIVNFRRNWKYRKRNTFGNKVTENDNFNKPHASHDEHAAS